MALTAMDDSDVAVRHATEVLLQQDGYHRQLLHRLQHHQAQIDALQHQLNISGTQHKLHMDSSRLYEIVSDEKRQLQIQNQSLLEKVKGLQAELESERHRLNHTIEAQTKSLEESRRQAEQYQLLLICATNLDDMSHWTSDTFHHEFDSSKADVLRLQAAKLKAAAQSQACTVARHLLQTLQTGVDKLEKIRLRDDVYDGMMMAADVFCETLHPVVDGCARLNSQLQPDCNDLSRHLQSVQVRFLEDLKQKKATHRMLKKALKNQDCTSQQPEKGRYNSIVDETEAVHLTEVLTHLRTLYGGFEQFALQQRMANELEQKTGAMQTEIKGQQDRVHSLESQLNESQSHCKRLQDLVDSLQAAGGMKSSIPQESPESLMERMKAEYIPLKEHRLIVQKLENEFAIEKQKYMTEHEAKVCAAQRRVEERHLLQQQHAQATVQEAKEKAQRLQESLQQEIERHKEWQGKWQTEHDQLISVRSQLQATQLEMKDLDNKLTQLQKERVWLMQERELHIAEAQSQNAMALEAASEAKHWKEAYQMVSHFCEDMRATIQAGIVSLTAHMDSSIASRLRIPAVDPFGHSTMAPSHLQDLCHTVKDLATGYVDTVNAFVRMLQSNATSGHQKELERRRRWSTTVQQLFGALNNLSKDYSRLKLDMQAMTGECHRFMVDSLHHLLLLCKENDMSKMMQWQELLNVHNKQLDSAVREKAEALQVLDEQKKTVTYLQGQLDNFTLKHDTEIQAVKEGYQRQIDDITLRLENSQASLQDNDALSYALQENDRLRKDLEMKAKEVYDVTMKLEERGRIQSVELSTLQEQCATLLRQLCEAERQNGVLHLKCLAKEEECTRLSSSAKLSRRGSPGRPSQLPFSLDSIDESIVEAR